MANPHALPADRLYRAAPPDALGFETTADVEPLVGALGQPDAMDALEFGLAITAPGYNLFVLGLPGSGRSTLVRQTLAVRAAEEPTPPDHCYVFNFRDPRRPRVLVLPTGRGPKFCSDVRGLIEELRTAIPAAIGSDAVAARRAAILEEHEKLASAILDELRRDFERDTDVALVGSANALVVVPARGGEPLGREDYLRLPEAERERIDERVREASARVFTAQRKVQELTREANARIEELVREVGRGVVRQRIAALEEAYRDTEPVIEYLEVLAEDVVEHTDRFARRPDEQETDIRAVLLGGAGEDFFKRYEVNLLVTHEPGSGAPVVEETDPHLRNLLGRMELRMQFGAMVTDFTRIAAGALQRANGGYLILDAAEVLTRPLVWPALKRVLRTRELRPAEATAEFGLLVADSLDPEPIEANVKVVLIGEPQIYYLLRALDTEFGELFKVKVDFQPQMDRTPEAEHGYARLIAAHCRAESLPAFSASAVAALVEEGARRAGNQNKLTTRFGEIIDLVREAAHWAAPSERGTVEAEDVERALRERERRDRRAYRELLELIERGVLAFDPTGERAGQLYGIGLTALGGELFGRPIRVMASAFMGTSGVVNIEREAKLAGPIHSKGFLVLSGYLGWLFARDHPLILSASVSFEQLYEEVEGDSASAAELYALLSAIGGVPLRQGIAVTGAVSEKGQVLPVGGVTEKVEGFFDACRRVGLSGEQGVVIPRRNIENLTLRREVREAVEAGRFQIHAIDRVEEGWPIVTGLEAGEGRPDGAFPPGTVHHAVQTRLSEWVDTWKRLAPAERRT